MNIRLTFLGAAQNVTGSRYLVQADGVKLLIDCGLYQERPFRERNWDDFPIPPAQLDAVLLTHAHVDHCGWLPKLVKEGFRGKVFCTSATAEIAQIVLLDSAHLQEEDAAYKKKRHQKEGRQGPHPYEPLYTAADAEACGPLYAPVRYAQPVAVAAGITATFHNAGHILGSAVIKLKIEQKGESRSLLFSGDVGRRDKPILRDPHLFREADYILLESTYGDRVHEPVEDVKDRLAEIVEETCRAGGNLVIPSFAIERSQELLYYLNDLFREKKICPLLAFLDSPMAVRVTEVFQNHPEMFDEQMKQRVRAGESPFDFPGLTMSRTTSQSKAINQIKGTVIIIAGSGMCTGGRIKHHLVNNISRPESTILFVGYQAVGTLGRHILEEPDEVRILGQKRPVRARIERIGGFSAHADREELLKWLGGMENHPRGLFLVHGEEEVCHKFAEFLRTKVPWEIAVPHYQQELKLD
ncbi:MAG: MBL fold metallo-hydrolase [Sedimentisphaerales bacterium]|nr:MBL fold metallo-hydrolase [Sedimentisphaerales bacterium]